MIDKSVFRKNEAFERENFSLALKIVRRRRANFFCNRGVAGCPRIEGVAALRQAQGPWDLWLAKESEGETSPFKKNRAGLLTNWIFESIFSAQVCSLWRF